MTSIALRFTKKILIPFIASCLFLGFIGFCIVLIGAFDNYKQKLVFADIENTRNILHKASDSAALYATKNVAIEEMYGQSPIRSAEGREVTRLFEDNLNLNLKKAVDLTTEAKNTNPQTWADFTELINKRLIEKQKLFDIEEDYVNQMRLYEQQKISDEEWDNYSQKTYPNLINEWNELNKNNTQFNIVNKIELNPPYEELEKNALSKYKPTFTGLVKDFWVSNPEIVEKYEDTEAYPIIIYVSDDRGNEIRSSEYNRYSGYETYKNNIFPTPLKVGEYILIGVGTQDLVERKMFYKFSSNSETFNKYYTEKRPANDGFTERGYLLYKVHPEESAIGQLEITVSIRAESDKHRVPQTKIDDQVTVYYRVE